MKNLILVLSAMALFVACKKEKSDEATKAPPAQAASSAPAKAPTPTPTESATKVAEAGAGDDAPLAVPEDFEEEADKQINSTNYASELDALEKEIDSE